jgi:hypothetical protein
MSMVDPGCQRASLQIFAYIMWHNHDKRREKSQRIVSSQMIPQGAVYMTEEFLFYFEKYHVMCHEIFFGLVLLVSGDTCGFWYLSVASCSLSIFPWLANLFLYGALETNQTVKDEKAELRQAMNDLLLFPFSFCNENKKGERRERK